MTKNFETISYTQEDNIGLLKINRPKQLNALNTQVLTELKAFFEDAPSISGLILTGEGDKAFIAGADIKEMTDMSAEEARSFGDLGQGVTFAIENAPFPVIACVQGFALGGGCEMAMSADFIFATNSAVFGQPEVKLGIIPGFGGTQRLAKVIGRNRAKELIYTGDNLTADEAFRLGLVNKLFASNEELLEGAKKSIKRMAKSSPLAIRTAKKVLNAGVDLNNKEGLKLELDSFSEIFSSYDFKEGTAAFIEKRKAEFKGE